MCMCVSLIFDWIPNNSFHWLCVCVRAVRTVRVCVCVLLSDFQHQVGHVDPLPADPQTRPQALQVSHMLQVLRQLVLSLAARPHPLRNQTLQVWDLWAQIHSGRFPSIYRAWLVQFPLLQSRPVFCSCCFVSFVCVLNYLFIYMPSDFCLFVFLLGGGGSSFMLFCIDWLIDWLIVESGIVMP